jgi:hypothetical protein
MRIAVRDAAGHAVPIGVAGSLSVEHPGPARGTRDRVRILEGGAIAHVGRTDGQVDVGGELVDTASMASSLSQHASIAAAHVVAVDRDDEVALAAYVVPRQGADVTHADLRRHLRDRGFDVVPRGFVEVDALPYAEGGAVDEDRLPSAWSERAEEMQEPRTDAEKYMASLWRDVLGVSRISVHDNFFAVGGHSLLCFRVVARVEQERGVRVSPRALLTGSLEQVAALLGDSAAPNAASSDVTTPRENGARPSQQPASWLERVRSLVRR